MLQMGSIASMKMNHVIQRLLVACCVLCHVHPGWMVNAIFHGAALNSVAHSLTMQCCVWSTRWCHEGGEKEQPSPAVTLKNHHASISVCLSHMCGLSVYYFWAHGEVLRSSKPSSQCFLKSDKFNSTTRKPLCNFCLFFTVATHALKVTDAITMVPIAHDIFLFVFPYWHTVLGAFSTLK